MASDPERGWSANGNAQRVTSLLLELRQRFYVLPWSLFLFAEGTDAELEATFHTHVVRVQGSGLSALLADFADQSITRLIEPDRAAKFTQSRGPQITAVSITENK